MSYIPNFCRIDEITIIHSRKLAKTQFLRYHLCASHIFVAPIRRGAIEGSILRLSVLSDHETI
jgi:hypothetical protein